MTGRPPSERPPSSRTSLAVLTGVMMMVAGTAIAAIAAFFFFVILEDDPAPPPVAASPYVAHQVALREAPASDGAVVTTLQSGASLALVGRTRDGAWYLIRPVEHPALVGWIPSDAVRSVGDRSALAVVAATDEPTPEPTATPTPGQQAPVLTPDLPDLLVDSVYSRENRLVVVVRNDGSADVNEQMFVEVSGREPVPIDIRPGEPLRAGDEIEMLLESHYVQRRGTAEVSVFTDPPIEEESQENNLLTTVVSPDLQNDVEVLGADLAPGTGTLRVTLRNNSPIPIYGPASVTVRASPPDHSLLGRQQVTLSMAPGLTERVEFGALTGVDLTRIQVIFSSEALDDANPNNDRWPR